MRYNDIFYIAKNKGFDKIQITASTDIEREVKISNDEVIYDQIADNTNYHVVALINGKTVSITSNYLNRDILNMLYDKQAIIEDIYEEEFLSDSSNNNTITYDLSHFDIKEYVDKLLSFNDLRDDLVNKIIITLNCVRTYKTIVNSEGVDISTPSNAFYLSMCLVNESDERNVMVTNDVVETNIENIDFDLIFNNLKKELSYKLQENSILTGKYNCIIKNDVLCILLNKIINCLSIEKIKENTSFLVNCLNKQVFSDKLSIVEDPLNKNYPGYTLFDDEGTFTKYKNIVTNGVLNTYLYDNNNASKDKCAKTGNKYGSGIGVRNAIIVPGTTSYEDLIKQMKDGLIIDECMGYHASVKLNNGYISLQAFGMIVENGHIKSAFVPVVMTTNFKELFNNIEEIASDLKFNSKATGSPSILFRNIDIASK